MGVVFTPERSIRFAQSMIREFPWAHDEVFVYGKRHITKRKTAWFGDRAFDYIYSGTKRTALPWTRVLHDIKRRVEEITAQSYNSCLANLYENGSQGMGWHRDSENELQNCGYIASVSFGAARRFDFKHLASREKISVLLENGSLLTMAGETQTHWQHQLPKNLGVLEPRINLTFRQMRQPENSRLPQIQ